MTCVHWIIISPPERGKQLIGRCWKCGCTKNYTELQKKIPILNIDRLLRGDINMEGIMAARTGGKKTRGRSKKLESKLEI